MTKPNDYALIIGVHDYRAADPTGRSDVAGALSDARAWVRQCLAMGFSPDRIRVLTSPRLSPEDFEKVGASLALGEATQEGIRAGIRWLMHEIAGEAPAAGLLTFSGHGEVSNGHLLLCPSDVTASLDGVIDVAELRQAIGDGKAAQNLTVLIDGCHGQVGLTREQSVRATLHAKAAALPVPERSGVAERVVSACRKDQESQSSHFGDERMGAFTWAMTSALGQWRIKRENGVNRSTVSHGELLSRTSALLSALSFEQEPVLSGPQGVAALPFLHPGDEVHPGETSEAPDGRRPGRQLDAGEKDYRVYVFGWNDGRFATVLVTNTTSTDGTFESGKEYWYLDQTTASQMSRSGTLTVELTQDDSWSTPPTLPSTAYQMTAAEPWWGTGGSYMAFASDPKLGPVGITFSLASMGDGNDKAYFISAVQWLNVTNGLWYFTSSSALGSTISLAWPSSAVTFSYQYFDGGFTRLTSPS